MSIAIEIAEREAFAAATAPETLLARPAIEQTRPTPEFIDELAARYLAAKAAAAQATEVSTKIAAEAIDLVKTWGVVPPGAEKSRRLNGRLAELTVTKSGTTTVIFDRVEMLRDALEANERGAFFARLFAKTEKYEIVKGAAEALKEEAMPKRLAEKVLNLFGRCITFTPKKPSLSVTIANPAKPAKKPRAKKGDQA